MITMTADQFTSKPTHIELTNSERLEMTARIMSGEQYATIAQDFGISVGTVQAVKRSRRWFKDYKQQILEAGYKQCLQRIKE